MMCPRSPFTLLFTLHGRLRAFQATRLCLVALMLAAATPSHANIPGPTLTAAAGDASVTLRWNQTATSDSTQEITYFVYRGTAPGGEGETSYASVPAPPGAGATITYTDKAVTNGTTYYYQVVTNYRSIGHSLVYLSDPSNEASATPHDPSLRSVSALTLSPTSISYGGAGTGTVTLSGPAPAGGLTVTLSSGNTAAATVPSSLTVPAGSTTATFTVTAGSAPTPPATATAVISAATPGTSAQQATLTVAPFLNITDLAAYATGSGKITLYWSGVSGATGYNIYRGTTSGGEDYNNPVNGTTPIMTQDLGPGVINLFVYSDNGLTDRQEYFYTVKAIYASTLSDPSNEDSDSPNPASVPWDSGSAASIVSAVNAIATAALPSDPEDPDSGPATSGPLFILSPDGVVYQGNFPDGSSAIATQAPGYYDEATNERVFSDGTVMVAPRDLVDTTQNGNATTDPIPVTPDSQDPAETSEATNPSPQVSGTVKDKGFPGLPPTGMTRQVATQPGATSFSGVVGLPNAADSTQVRLDAYHTGYMNPVTYKELVYPDGAEIYTGGHVSFPASVIAANPKTLDNDSGNIDAGLQLTTYPYPNTMWQPFIMPGIKQGTTQKLLLGGVGGLVKVGDWKTFISGEIRMVFDTPMITQVPSKAVLVSYQTPYSSNGTTIQVRHVSAVDANNIPSYDKTLMPSGVTYYYSGAAARLWRKNSYNLGNPALGNNSFILKRTNVISQTLNPNSANRTHFDAPIANAPNNDVNSGFRTNASYVLGAYWGDADPYGMSLTGLSSSSWTDDSSVTGVAGSFPGTATGLDRRFIKSTLNNPFFWETNLNMKTSVGTLPGF